MPPNRHPDIISVRGVCLPSREIPLKPRLENCGFLQVHHLITQREFVATTEGQRQLHLAVFPDEFSISDASELARRNNLCSAFPEDLIGLAETLLHLIWLPYHTILCLERPVIRQEVNFYGIRPEGEDHSLDLFRAKKSPWSPFFAVLLATAA